MGGGECREDAGRSRRADMQMRMPRNEVTRRLSVPVYCTMQLTPSARAGDADCILDGNGDETDAMILEYSILRTFDSGDLRRKRLRGETDDGSL